MWAMQLSPPQRLPMGNFKIILGLGGSVSFPLCSYLSFLALLSLFFKSLGVILRHCGVANQSTYGYFAVESLTRFSEIQSYIVQALITAGANIGLYNEGADITNCFKRLST